MEQAYKIAVKNGAGWRDHADIQLLISVGQPYHEGSKFAALVDWINRQGFHSVRVAVNDGLQGWNNLADGVGGAKAFADAEAAGQQWIDRHNDRLQSFRAASVSVTRWRTWLDHPDYAQTESKLHELLADKDGSLAQVMRSDSQQILKRRTKRISVLRPDRFLECSLEYMREEIAVLALQHKDLARADIYPGTMLSCIEWFRTTNQSLPPELEPLRHRYSCRIDFRKVTPV